MDGTLVAKYIYDAWGNCTISGDTTNYALAHANPIRYRGYYYDSETGLGDSWATKLLYQMRTLTVRIICYSLFTPKKGANRHMEEIEVMLERHEQRIKTLEREMAEMKTVQAEIRSMNDTLVTLTTELKHANEHLARHEQKIDEIKSVPSQSLQQIRTAVISALAGGLISMLLSMVLR